MSAAADQVAYPLEEEVYLCAEPGCPWKTSWAYRGFLLAVPKTALHAIGAHARWHDRADVREGLVTMCWSEATATFEQVATARVEQWCTIARHSDYEVSDLGRVRRATPGWCTSPGRILAQHVDTVGYPTVGLTRPVAGRSKTVRVRVHVLVAKAFLGPRLNGDHVDHINGNKTDNRACNLEYVAPAENSRRASKLGLLRFSYGENNGRHTRPERSARGERSGNAKLTEAAVREIRRRRRAGQGVVAIGIEFGINGATVSRIANGKSWAHVEAES